MDPITTIEGPGADLIDVAVIERELAAMWRSAASDREHGPVTRACRTNLVVLDGVAPEAVEEITRRHPARLIVVSSAAAGEEDAGGAGQAPPIGARVSALCHLRPGGGGLLCSERILLRTARGAEPHVASAVRSLLVGDLPVAILGGPEALGRYAPLGLLAVADRVLVDSTGTAPDIWDALGKATGGAGRLVDLAWLRLDGFRHAVAQAIAHSPLRKAMHRLEGVDIGHCERPTAAILVAAWLGQRLKWGRPRSPRPGVAAAPGPTPEPPEPGPGVPRTIEVSGRGRRVRVRLGTTQSPDDLVLLLRTPDVELRAALDERAAAVSIVLGAGRTRLRRGGPRGRPGGGGGRRERLTVAVPSLASLTVDALAHRGVCDPDLIPVQGRARDLAAAFAGAAAAREREVPPEAEPEPPPEADREPPGPA